MRAITPSGTVPSTIAGRIKMPERVLTAPG